MRRSVIPVFERRTYDKPPIEEAVCEFRFNKDDWDPTTPGRLFDKIKKSYPALPREVKQYHTEVAVGPQNPASVNVRELPPRTRFSTQDENRVVSIAPRFLSVSMRKPYSNWEEFKSQILDAFRKHREITGAEDVVRVGIRYINKILIELRTEVDLGQYFECAPQDLSELGHNTLPSNLVNMFSRQEYNFGDSVRMARIFASTEAPPRFIGILLDIDVYWQSGDSGSPDISELVERLRLRERVAFEASITDDCRKLFH